MIRLLYFFGNSMAGDRTYSTREVAQMWNVSESTVKRWADCFGLQCYRTPGGHRRFRLEDICEFQQKRSFEATGILTTENVGEFVMIQRALRRASGAPAPSRPSGTVTLP